VGSTPTFRTIMTRVLGMSVQKNILMINPWIYDFTAYDFWLKPLGLLYVAALLENHTNLKLNFIDCLDRHHPLLKITLPAKPDGRGSFYKEEVPKPRVLAGIPRKFSRYGIPMPLFQRELDQISPPDLVLLTCTMTYWYLGVQVVVEQIREKFGGVPIVLGGVYPSLLPQHALSQTGVDAICAGRAGNRLFSLINEMLGDGTCPDLRFETLEQMPFPAFHFLRNTDSLPILTSRGCPLRCSFCASHLLFDRFEQRSSASVVRELEILHERYKTKDVCFYDDALLSNKKKHIVPILKNVIEKSLSLAFHTPNGLHIGEIDDELALLLKQSGFKSLYLSQETFEDELIEEFCSKVSSGDLKKVLDHLERTGFLRKQVHVYLIAGLPGQSVASVRQAVVRVRGLGAQAHVAYFSPIPGTDDWKKIVSRGLLDEEADPLLHNKLAFFHTWGAVDPGEFDSLKMILGS
jgi:radical SAM superfamily enzyme YgiQ (UPF0313 family)